jgi:hypothetical protein
LDFNAKFGLIGSKRFTSITRETSGMSFDIPIQQFVWRFQPISQEVFQKGYREAISAVSQTRSIEKKDADSPTLKIFPDPLLQAIPRFGFQNGSRDVAFEEWLQFRPGVEHPKLVEQVNCSAGFDTPEAIASLNLPATDLYLTPRA